MHFYLTFKFLKGLFWIFWIELDLRWSSVKFTQKMKVLSETWDSSLCWMFKISNKGSFWHNSGSSLEMELNPASKIASWLYLVKLAGGNFLSWLWVRFNTVMFAGRSSGIWVSFRWLQSATSRRTAHLWAEDAHSIQKGNSPKKQETGCNRLWLMILSYRRNIKKLSTTFITRFHMHRYIPYKIYTQMWLCMIPFLQLLWHTSRTSYGHIQMAQKVQNGTYNPPFTLPLHPVAMI